MRLFCFSLALLISAGVVLGEGTYQRTKDEKTMVWNDAPKQGDTASWNGDRDDESYARGFGTLTWYTADTQLFASYYGNMIRGKLEGPVNVHSRGKIAYAIFVDGKRRTSWKNGRAPSRQLMAKRLEAVRQKVAKTAKTEEKKENPPKDGSTVADAQPPTGYVAVEPPAIKSEPAPETVAKVEKENPPVVAAASPSPGVLGGRITSNIQVPHSRVVKEEAAATSSPVKSEAAPETVAKVERENLPSVAAAASATPSVKPASSLTEPGRDRYSLEEGPAEGILENPFSSEPSSVAASATPMESRAEVASSAPESPSIEHAKSAPDKSVERSEAPASTDASITAEEKKPDNSVQLVMQPPSSLRPPSGQDSESEAQLTKAEVIGAADTAARAGGYDLRNYDRPRADYNSASGTWSLVYDHKPVGGNAETGEPFSVTVDDKTKKASIVAGL